MKRLLIATLSLAVSGCALLSKGDVAETHYYTPESSKARLSSADSAAPAPTNIELRLGRVTSGPMLRERMVYRDAAYELGEYEDRRWTERPETYVRHALGRALYEEHGFHRVLAGVAPTLDVEVLAFEELRLANGRASRVRLKVIVHDDRDVMLEDTLTVDRQAGGKDASTSDIVAAMSEALDAAADTIALRIAAVLAPAASP